MKNKYAFTRGSILMLARGACGAFLVFVGLLLGGLGQWLGRIGWRLECTGNYFADGV